MRCRKLEKGEYIKKSAISDSSALKRTRLKIQSVILSLGSHSHAKKVFFLQNSRDKFEKKTASRRMFRLLT